ncbi:MAG: hypothetical protein K2P84_05405, partial [Undibacterium sp.]|nr:hypothetical protein [Undibacterium sp.]
MFWEMLRYLGSCGRFSLLHTVQKNALRKPPKRGGLICQVVAICGDLGFFLCAKLDKGVEASISGEFAGCIVGGLV